MYNRINNLNSLQTSSFFNYFFKRRRGFRTKNWTLQNRDIRTKYNWKLLFQKNETKAWFRTINCKIKNRGRKKGVFEAEAQGRCDSTRDPDSVKRENRFSICPDRKSPVVYVCSKETANLFFLRRRGGPRRGTPLICDRLTYGMTTCFKLSTNCLVRS